MTPTLRDFRDGLFVVAAYFAVCALTCDAHAAHFKEPIMNTDTAAPSRRNSLCGRSSPSNRSRPTY